DGSQELVGFKDCGEFGDLAGELIALLFQLQTRELGESPQWQLENVVGLDLAQVEDLHQPRARTCGVVAGADHRDDLVDIEDRDEAAEHEMDLLFASAPSIRRTSPHDFEAVIDVDLEQFLQPECQWLAINERDVVDT